jgi:hypothetical protein
VVVFFNDPLPVAKHELRAVRLALAAQERVAQLVQEWRRWGKELGIGIEAGNATLGRIGFEGRYDYAALGRCRPPGGRTWRGHKPSSPPTFRVLVPLAATLRDRGRPGAATLTRGSPCR